MYSRLHVSTHRLSTQSGYVHTSAAVPFLLLCWLNALLSGGFIGLRQTPLSCCSKRARALGHGSALPSHHIQDELEEESPNPAGLQPLLLQPSLCRVN